MDNSNFKFNTIFEGIQQTQDAIDNELALLKQINEEQKKELRKTKIYNGIMAGLAVASLILAVLSVFGVIKH